MKLDVHQYIDDKRIFSCDICLLKPVMKRPSADTWDRPISQCIVTGISITTGNWILPKDWHYNKEKDMIICPECWDERHKRRGRII